MPLVDDLEALEQRLHADSATLKVRQQETVQTIQAAFRREARALVSLMTEAEEQPAWTRLSEALSDWEDYIRSMRVDLPKALRAEHARFLAEVAAVDAEVENIVSPGDDDDRPCNGL